MSDQKTPKSNVPEYSVSEISAALKKTVESSFEKVRIRGEISGFKRAGSGHVYLKLKDDLSVIDGVMWRSTAARLNFNPEDGLEVVAQGRVTTYAARSQYQIVITQLEPAGIGALLALLEERRKKLASEGLFDQDRKKAIPYIPNTIGVITSPTGAVLRDILHRLRDRFPRPIVVWPVLVQGNNSAKQVAAAIQGFNNLRASSSIPKPDVLIVARGGGSIEDLLAFNEEIVIRAASESSIPLISAIGHETDTTLLDFVADVRAPTPTAAAEMAVPVRSELVSSVSELERQLLATIQRTISENKRAIDILGRSLPSSERIIEDAILRLDDRVETMSRIFLFHFTQLAQQLEKIEVQIPHPQKEIDQYSQRLQFKMKELSSAAAQILRSCFEPYLRWSRDDRLGGALDRIVLEKSRAAISSENLLESYSYKNVLDRGYAVVRNNKNAPITRSKDLQHLKSAKVEFADGESKILIKEHNSLDKRKRDGTRPKDKLQGNLL
ncbi:MAG: exodeoxyribonuclease VII large subunit [Pseudomonadota bacterium]|nr:exodeoxyribonuclease VII large subunit [Pseudomonadota bacterium]